MTYDERELAKRRVEAWITAGPLLQKVRDADIRTANTADAMRVFTGSATWGVINRPPRPTSGLIEQQRCFAKGAANE